MLISELVAEVSAELTIVRPNHQTITRHQTYVFQSNLQMHSSLSAPWSENHVCSGRLAARATSLALSPSASEHAFTLDNNWRSAPTFRRSAKLRRSDKRKTICGSTQVHGSVFNQFFFHYFHYIYILFELFCDSRFNRIFRSVSKLFLMLIVIFDWVKVVENLINVN